MEEKENHLEDLKNLNKKTKRKENDLISEEKIKIKYNMNKFKSDPTKIEYFKDLSYESYESYPDILNTNLFCAFKSVDDIHYLIYINRSNDIVSYDLIYDKIINVIKNLNEYLIHGIYHYFDNIEKNDIILTLASSNSSIKLWKVQNWECFLNLKRIYPVGYIYSACFLNYNNNNYFVTSHFSALGKPGKIKIFDFKGNKICDINDSNYMSSFVYTYYDNNLSQYYIIGSFDNFIQSYKYNQNIIYHKYRDNEYLNSISFGCFIIDDFEGIIKLIAGSSSKIKIWNYHSGELLKKIECRFSIKSLCIWNNIYLFIGGQNYTIKLIDLDNEKVIKELKSNKYDFFSSILYIQKIVHPHYGECFLTQGNEEGLKLWVNKDYLDNKNKIL